jgi:hypothetical protein
MTLADGSYDVSITAQDAASDPFQGDLARGIVVDNTPPTAVLTNPGSSLNGVVTLTASAQDAGTGVDAVKFESSPAGANTWTTIGVATSHPYTASFDTRQLTDGSYDLRVEATDDAGSTAASPVIPAVAISNPGAQQWGNLTITSYVAPATNIQLLGEIARSPQHETWAFGQTSAPPPIVNGVPLPYTAQGGGQGVLLQYLDSTGWEIVDVLRNPDGSAYPLASGGNLVVSGQMNDAGEAWLVVRDTGNGHRKIGVFHRGPGGQFLLDPTATATLMPLVVNGTPTIRIATAPDKSAYGLLVSGAPPSQSQIVPSPVGPVAVTTELEYGSLGAGSWSIQAAPLPASYTAPGLGTTVKLDAADPNGPGTGWAALEQSVNGGDTSTIVSTFDQNGWHFVTPAGLDAFDLTGEFAPTSAQSAGARTLTVTPTALRADSSGVWIAATAKATSGGATGQLVALYDQAAGRVVRSWCTSLPRQSFGCAQPLDLNHPATVPDAIFDTPQGPVALALSPASQFIDVYAYGAWTTVSTPGYTDLNSNPGESVFVDPSDGWIAGANTLARVAATPTQSALASWPEANRNPLVSVALPPGQSTTDTPGALAVGLNGTALHYGRSVGWQVDATPPQTHHIMLTGVAFNGASTAFAVGQLGTILRWDGSSWSEDPQSVHVTTASLNAVAFRNDGQGWAVGGFGTILHYDGTSWSTEQIDPADVGADVTSVAVAGQDVYAIANGNLITRLPDGTWQPVNPSLLPSLPPPVGSLKLVSGLPDGGLAVAGTSLLMLMQSAGGSFQYAPQSFQGIPVALAAFRTAGDVQAFVSVAPPIASPTGISNGVGGFPAGDGDLILESGGGWHDLSTSLFPTQVPDAIGDGVVQPDPVLAVASSPDGTHAWGVGGYAGTHAADGVGTDQILAARPPGWLASAIWRYDAGGSVQSPAVTQAQVNLPAMPGTVSFAFFSSPMCKYECAAVQNAQPDVNLRTAAAQIAAFAQQPVGPAFAILGGNVRGPINLGPYLQGSAAVDLAHLPSLLAPLGKVPLYAAYGPIDGVPTFANPAQPWASTFANAPAPFGSGATPAGITPHGGGDTTGQVNKYYAFDASQNGGTLRVIVLDNSAGSLEASAPGQTAWLTAQLSSAQAAGTPVVAVAAEPLTQASDGDAVATQLVNAGVLGVFTTSGGAVNNLTTQTDQVVQVPSNPNPATPIPQIPDYEGATLTYQQSQNNGVLWYEVSVDTAARKLTVQAVPVISSLALEPLNGLTVARSLTLSFQAIARRPAATIATTPSDPTFPGYSQYVSIPASSCSTCIGPSYSFKSSNTVVGDFVVPSGPGSPYPKLNPQGKTTPSSKSGLFCAFNSGTTTVSVTSGLLTASLPVTVQAGHGFGPPCGTVPGGTITKTITVGGETVIEQGTNPSAGVNPPPTAPLQLSAVLPAILPPPPPPPAVKPPVTTPPVVVPFTAAGPIAQAPTLNIPPIVPPLIPPPITPVPPGGATVSAQAAARREEKARKHASQSAYATRPAGASAEEWFYPVVGVVTVLALLLAAGGLRPGPRPRPALAALWERADEPRGRLRR